MSQIDDLIAENLRLRFALVPFVRVANSVDSPMSVRFDIDDGTRPRHVIVIHDHEWAAARDVLGEWYHAHEALK